MSLVYILILVLVIHPLLSRSVGIFLLSTKIVRFIAVVGVAVILLISSSPFRPIVVAIQLSTILSIRRVAWIRFPVRSRTVLFLCISLFVGGLVRSLVFFHDGEHPVVHPVLFVVEAERGVVWILVHFSIKIMRSNKLTEEILSKINYNHY